MIDNLELHRPELIHHEAFDRRSLLALKKQGTIHVGNFFYKLISRGDQNILVGMRSENDEEIDLD